MSSQHVLIHRLREMRRLGRRLGTAAAVTAVTAAVGLAASTPATASDPTTLYVDAAGGAVTGCTAPGADACQTLSEGITAAEALSGNPDVTIDVAGAATPYAGQLTIDDTMNNSLTIAGAGASTTSMTGDGTSCVVTIDFAAPVTISGMTITDGQGSDGGGGGVCNEGTVTLDHDTISGNNGDSGAGINNGYLATLTDDTVTGNIATQNGGAIYSGNNQESAGLTVTGSMLTHDTADGYGGALYNGGSGFTLTNDTLSNDSAVAGGGIENEVYGVVTGTTFLDDSATGSSTQGIGGGIYSFDKQLTLTDDSFDGDTATYAGGGLFTGGPITAGEDTFSADSAQYGGAIDAGGYVTLTNSTLVGNSATAGGGGIDDTSRTTLSDDTFSNDTAPAGEGPGIYDGNTVLIGSSILDKAGCTIPTGATMTSEGYNVESDNSCALGSGSKVSNASIGLATSLAANGSTGPKTLAIGATSSAVDEVPAAACAATTTDERGDSRPGIKTQTACDAGAYEYQGSAKKPPPPPPAKKKPSAPRSPHAKAGKKSITVSWKAPASSGGLTITAYHAYCSLKKKVSTKGGGTSTGGPHRSVKVKKLKAKKKYYCVVLATNAKGNSPASKTVSAKTKK